MNRKKKCAQTIKKDARVIWKPIALGLTAVATEALPGARLVGLK